MNEVVEQPMNTCVTVVVVGVTKNI
jgi:hypothetical protein